MQKGKRQIKAQLFIYYKTKQNAIVVTCSNKLNFLQVCMSFFSIFHIFHYFMSNWIHMCFFSYQEITTYIWTLDFPQIHSVHLFFKKKKPTIFIIYSPFFSSFLPTFPPTIAFIHPNYPDNLFVICLCFIHFPYLYTCSTTHPPSLHPLFTGRLYILPGPGFNLLLFIFIIIIIIYEVSHSL